MGTDPSVPSVRIIRIYKKIIKSHLFNWVTPSFPIGETGTGPCMVVHSWSVALPNQRRSGTCIQLQVSLRGQRPTQPGTWDFLSVHASIFWVLLQRQPSGSEAASCFATYRRVWMTCLRSSCCWVLIPVKFSRNSWAQCWVVHPCFPVLHGEVGLEHKAQ